jgi:hypothetical protein
MAFMVLLSSGMSHFQNPLGYDSSGVSFPMLTKELATFQLAEQPSLQKTADQIKQIPVPETLRRGKTRREKHPASVAGQFGRAAVRRPAGH